MRIFRGPVTDVGQHGEVDRVDRIDGVDRSLVRRLTVASGLALIGAGLCYLLLVRTSLGQRFDNAAFLGSQQSLSTTRAADTRQLRHITADSFAVVLLVLVAIGVLRRRVWLGVAAAAAAALAVLGTDALKYWVLTRPTLTTSDAVVPAQTFPSGHTATAVACALALMLVTAPRWRGVAAVVAGAYAWVTAAQVQTAGWHRPSDAIGAALLAFACVAAVGAILARRRPVSTQSSGPHRIALGVLVALAAVDTAAAVWGLRKVLPRLGENLGNVQTTANIRHDAYLTGLSATVLVVILLVTALLLLAGRVDLDYTTPARLPTTSRGADH